MANHIWHTYGSYGFLCRKVSNSPCSATETPPQPPWTKGTSPEPTDAPETTTEGEDEGPPDAACHSGLAFGALGGPGRGRGGSWTWRT